MRLKALVKVDAQRELGELLAQPFERRKPCSRFLDGALGAVDGFERCALERLETLCANLSDDGGYSSAVRVRSARLIVV